jgi:MYXO-CTERM domain-containing protein
VESSYHTDYTPDPERIRIIETDESGAINGMIEISKSAPLSSAGSSYDTEANVITSFGMHKASTRAKITNGNKERVMVYAQSMFTDDWVVRGPTSGASGELHFGVTLHGNHRGEGNGLSYDVYCDTGCYAEVTNSPDIDTFTGSQLAQVTLYYNVDTWLTFTSELNVESFAGSYGEGESEESHIDFGHTAVITSLELPPGHTLETASGTTYPLDYTPPGGGGGGGGGCSTSGPAPGEPVWPVLLWMGLLAVVIVLMRRRAIG